MKGNLCSKLGFNLTDNIRVLTRCSFIFFLHSLVQLSSQTEERTEVFLCHKHKNSPFMLVIVKLS